MGENVFFVDAAGAFAHIVGMKPAQDITRADRLIKDAERHLTAYIFRKIAEAGNDYKLAEKTGIPRSTIQSTLRTGGVLALRSLAYRLAGVPKKPRAKLVDVLKDAVRVRA